MIIAVKANKLSLFYKNKSIINRLNLNVMTNDFFIIIGPNGAGKTSLLKILSGTITPSAGSVLIYEKSLKSYTRKELSRIVALVPQNEQMEIPFTVEETILMGRFPHLPLLSPTRKQDRIIVEEAMEFTEVQHLADRHLDQLSGGERQRVIIARAICQQPKIILLDEPTAALDPAHQIKIMDLMEQLRTKKDITVIMVSHDLNLAAMYANHLLLLKNGEVQKEGSPEDVLTSDELEKGYGCKILVDKYPLGKGLRINLVPEKYNKTI